jgi:hypothetical protein
MDNFVPPLKLWLYVLVIVILGSSGFLVYAQLKYPQASMFSQGFSESLENAIVKNDAVGPNEKSLIIFGSSFARCALPYVPVIRAKVSAQNKKVNVLRISMSGLNMTGAEYSNFFNYITEFPPDYLFLESNNLNIDHGAISSVDAVDLLYDDIFRSAKKLIGSELSDFNERPPVKSYFYSDKFNTSQFNAMISAKHSVRVFTDNKVANAAFAKLTKQKTKIIFLNFPMSPKSDPVYLNNDEKNKLRVLLALYEQNYGIECWNYPGFLDNSYFYDAGHVNYKGAKKYTEWFVSEFNKLK